MPDERSDFNAYVRNSLNTLLEHAAESKSAIERLEKKIDNVAADLRVEMSRLSKAITHTSAHTTHMLDDYAANQLSLREEMSELRRRIEALEKRNPAA